MASGRGTAGFPFVWRRYREGVGRLGVVGQRRGWRPALSRSGPWLLRAVSALAIGRSLAWRRAIRSRGGQRVGSVQRSLEGFGGVRAALERAGEPLPLRERLEAILDEAVRLTGARGGLVIVDATTSCQTDVVVSIGLSPEQVAVVRRMTGVTRLGEAASEARGTAALPEEPCSRRLAPSLGELLLAPARCAGRTGVLCLVGREDGGVDPLDEAVVRCLATSVGLAVELEAWRDRALRATAELQADRRRYGLLVSAVAHDLKNFVQAVFTAGQLLLRLSRSLGEEQQRLLDIVVRESRHVNRLVSDLRDAIHMEARLFTLERRPSDLVAVTRKVVETQRALAASHRFVVEAPERLEGWWDPDRLTQVVTNLVSNAVKYSPGGGEVRIRIAPRSGEVEWEVTDPGVGFDREEAALLFQPFHRLERGGKRTLRGTGLGLYIAKGIVESHGGRIWASSPGPGRGATFSFVLPLDPTPATQ